MAAIALESPAAWFNPDDYPADAIRASRQGRVVVDLGIDSTGAAVTCAIKESSGTAVLDERTCALAKEHGRYNPAMDDQGRPIAATTSVAVRWQIPELPTAIIDAANYRTHSVTVENSFTAAGILAACRIVAIEPPDAKVAAAACPDKMIGTQSAIVMRDGRAVAYKVVSRSSSEIDPAD